MKRWKKALLFAVLLALNFSFSESVARTQRVLVGDDIPRHLAFQEPLIMTGSDSLYLNGRLLARDTDYRVDAGPGYFDLTSLNATPHDTLMVVYHELPAWLQKTYGRSIPDVEGNPSTTSLPVIPSLRPTASSFAQDINLSGAKSFRFSTRTEGGSDFGQTLDLKIAGQLAPGMSVSGAISDRGYDPTYGTANSRLNELDKINLQLKSQRLFAQIGDITLRSSNGAGPKQVSGAALDLSYPTWHAEAGAARPKGRFASIALTGQDGFQGPYEVGQTGRGGPIVPGSEKVWLNGSQLERGADKDYTLDYPLGEITFNVNHPVDSRTRIEIDFEPQLTAYRGELLNVGGGVQVHDSLFAVSASAIREGDDKNQPLAGDLSETDRSLLASSGSNDVYRPGVTADTAGDYILDSAKLPDSVYQFVGRGIGRYRITFSYVGPGKGDYRFLGSGNYRYIGPQAAEYLPVTLLTRPERTDYYQTSMIFRPKAVGDISLDINQTSHDGNLFSTIGDATNKGLFYRAALQRQWSWNGAVNTLTVRRRLREANYTARERLDPVDFGRDFLLPFNYIAMSDEILNEASMLLSPARFISLTPNYSTLNYRNAFDARGAGISGAVTARQNLTFDGGWRTVRSSLAGTALSGNGNADTYRAGVHYGLIRNLSLESSVERDTRENQYFDTPRGTRYLQSQVSLASAHERIGYEYYSEDSLVGDWVGQLKRHRLLASSDRRFGDLTYSAVATVQKIEESSGTRNNFLGRTGFSYSNVRQRLTASASYLMSNELRTERGITYLEVEKGRGNYSYEDGLYVPDPDGNYVQVEEVLSTRARVRRGQKSFDFSKDFTQAVVRLSSEIQEELLNDGSRIIWWVLPFYSDETQPYLYYSRRYNADLRFFAWGGFHVVNLLVADELERRLITDSDRARRDTKGRIMFKEMVTHVYLDESIELFRSNRDDYFSGAGDISGFKLSANARHTTDAGEFNSGFSIRRAHSAQEERSDIYAVSCGARHKIWRRGEMRGNVELYRQILADIIGVPSYQLTDSRYGTRGAIWMIALNYGLKEQVRINFSISGRHSDDRVARITGRGEMVAGF